MSTIRRHRRAALALAASVATVLIGGLIWWAVASGAKACQPGYE